MSDIHIIKWFKLFWWPLTLFGLSIFLFIYRHMLPTFGNQTLTVSFIVTALLAIAPAFTMAITNRGNDIAKTNWRIVICGVTFLVALRVVTFFPNNTALWDLTMWAGVLSWYSLFCYELHLAD